MNESGDYRARIWSAIMALTFASTLSSAGATLFVSISNSAAVAPYTNWATGAATIQDAVDAALDGDLVLVTDGVYNAGVTLTPGFQTSNRVVITKNIRVESVNGPAVTIIEGLNDGVGSNLTSNVRCVFITNGLLAGFTLTNGSAPDADSADENRNGGGAYAEGGALSNCTVTACRSAGNGGGVFGGHLTHCLLRGNSALNGGGAQSSSLDYCELSENLAYERFGGGARGSTLNYCSVLSNHANDAGGGADGCTLNYCLIASNSAGQGGGAQASTLDHCVVAANSGNRGGGVWVCTLTSCTVTRNAASHLPGGAGFCTIVNCIVYANTSPHAGVQDIADCTMTFSCASGLPEYPGPGNIGGDPQFVNPDEGDFHLGPNSPCIDVGTNDPALPPTDFGGNPRIVNGAVDMGAFESRARNYITAQAGALGGGAPVGGGYYFPGSTATVAATPTGYWIFVEWTDGETNPVRSFTMPSSNLVLTAIFSKLSGQPILDFEGDDSDEVAVFHRASGKWYTLFGPAGASNQTLQWGWKRTVPVPGDYDGDGRTDYAVYGIGASLWSILESSTLALRTIQWGGHQDIPVPADYDGDGHTDIAVYRRASGYWYILESSSGEMRTQQWGWDSAVPVPCDYDGDGKADIAVFELPSSHWAILNSNGSPPVFSEFGFFGVIPVPADYDGDHRMDIAVYDPRAGMWYFWQTRDGTLRIQQWGWFESSPIPADFDGDGLADHAVYDAQTGNWYIPLRQSNSLMLRLVNWGWSEALPVLPQYQINAFFNLYP